MIRNLDKILIKWISSFSEAPKIIPYGLEKENRELSFATVNGGKAIVHRKFNNGGSVGEVIFELSTRVSSADSVGKFWATELLDRIGEYCETENLPFLGINAEALCAGQRTHAVLTNRSDNGNDEYAAQYSLVYVENAV